MEKEIELNINNRQAVLLSLLLVIGMLGCSNSVKNRTEIPNISVIVSGYGRVFENAEDTIGFLWNCSREVYLLEVTRSGYLKTTFGFGEQESVGVTGYNNIFLNCIVSIDSVTLNQYQLNSIMEIADRLKLERPYVSKELVMDAWIAKLNIDTQESIFFIDDPFLANESGKKGDYTSIVDLMVNFSPIAVRGYR